MFSDRRLNQQKKKIFYHVYVANLSRDVVELPPYGADAKDTDKKRVKRRQLVAWLVVAGLTAGVALGWGARKHD
ncbi:hypothetical protein MGG_17898 [Pyricularia oryzae 70-15]|uniref:Uncharacterized protein n=1 Tax=Pyricularia oryzae (strain 70-15 / ATCC MYA-4617 / FGSC 8958) TaxID=242507 RepID=G4NL31_PYRO7|nr:uncharacterized protein MGG_17898 [Pyricularia oryzae 70-15]EHA45964.1 hypothetical protein MGG_17898 [Pyricularia oryzae 70-15]